MLFPSLFVPVVAEEQGDHIPSCVVLKGKAIRGRAVQVEEYGGRLRGQLSNFGLLVLFKQMLPLSIDGDNGTPM